MNEPLDDQIKELVADNPYEVVCFDCQEPHEMRLGSWVQAEAFAAMLTRNEVACPHCGCTTWASLTSVASVVDGDHAQLFDSMQV